MELASIGIDTIELTGSQSIGRGGVIGKGCVGIVVKARMRDTIVALKIRRIDADRRSMDHEADMLQLANSVGVGPRFLARSQNLLAMEFIDGLPLHRWITVLPKRGSKRRLRGTLERLLDDCFELDRIGLDHGELSEAPKNVLVEKSSNPRIVDFESASNRRRPSNVTSITQYLLIGGGPAKRVRDILGWRRRAALIRALREYKQAPDQDGFQRVKIVAGL
jgi:putative serine/threonine protein kinase